MSCVPPVGGRVSAIKSQFESLSSIESLDISNSPKPKKAAGRFQFQRAATSFDLINRNDKVKSIVKTWTTSSSGSAANNNLPKQRSDSSLLPAQRSAIARQPDDPYRSSLKRTKETADVKLARHTSDPIKRSSIKRSPAFRVGDKQNKAILVRQSPIGVTSEFSENKLEKFIAKSCHTDMERMQQSGLTDSLKAALRQPLPPGPPPKKPPRSFYGNSNTVCRETNRILEEDTFEQDQQSSASPSSHSKPQIQDKINFLETHLALKSVPKTPPASVKFRAPLQKSKTELVLQGSKLLDCIACHRESTPVYDSVNIDDGEGVHVPLLQKSRTTSIVGRKPAEHIYMEPFGHLNQRDCRKVKKSSPSNGSNVAAKSGGACSSENHKTTDAHYLCTAISDNKPDDETVEKESSISLEKTYDEINILLNAAFQQKQTGTMSGITGGDVDENRHSTKLSRSLTEKRKDYVRRVSLAPQTLKGRNYGTVYRTFKSPVVKTFMLEDDRKNNNSENNENINSESRFDNFSKTDRRSIRSRKSNDRATGGVALVEGEAVPIENNEMSNVFETDYSQKIFQVCMLVGYNSSTNTAYIKSKFPQNEPVPDNIEQLIFPSNKLIRTGRDNQEYCLVLTDDSGFKVYGYCRRVLPENCEECLPLAYCIISVTKALGFYQKVLKEIESRHGQSEAQLNITLQNLQNAKMPTAGKYLHIKVPLPMRPKAIYSSNYKISPKRLSLEANPKWLTESAAQAAFVVESDFDLIDRSGKRGVGIKSLMEEFEDGKKHSPPFDLSLISRSLINRDSRFDEILLRRPNDLRLENTEISDLLECLGPDLLINIFASLLHERKVIIQGKNISLVSKSILALDAILYPFRWQYTIVTILPQSLIEICQAPFPVLAGVLEEVNFEIEDGILVDMDLKEITQSCGDEHIIVPETLRKSMKLSLEMVDLIDQGKMLSSVLISEAFLRFFIELFVDTNLKRFHKDDFIQVHREQSIKFFLEWFLETSMFRHFRNERYVDEGGMGSAAAGSINLLKCDSFYNLFDARLIEKGENKTKTSQNIETIVKNSKIINKKGKTFKDRFKQLLG